MQILFSFNTRDSRSSPLFVNVLHLFCIYTFFNVLCLGICKAEDPAICNTGRYANGSEYEANLSVVLNKLVVSSSGGYTTSVWGKVPNRIYGHLQCREDASTEECQTCSQIAKTRILQVCPNAVGGRIWMLICYIRYDSYNFTGILDTKSRIFQSVDDATDPVNFSSSVRGLLQNLTEEISLSKKKEGIGFNPLHSINGLVQCCGYISNHDCDLCLRSATSQLLLATNNGTRLSGVCLTGSCIVRYEASSIYSEKHSPPLPLQKALNSQKSSKKTALVGGAVGMSLVILWIGVALYPKRRKLKAAVFGRPIRQEGWDMEEESLIREDCITIFDMETLRNATGNFHNDNKLGEGGFGPVYKGTLIDGKDIAVKKLSIKSSQGKKEFLNEVKVVKFQHKNLVHIFGCCAEGSERLLVYEYLPNKSLDKFLFDPLLSKQLNWEMRFNIILGIARGLVFLHEDSRQRIIHRDVKASNILLDQRMNPKIADFGLARLFVEDQSHVHTKVAGTFGYMAPEYAMRGQLSVKSDVYSFGVLLLEIVCGRRNTDFESMESEILIELVWRSFERGHVVDVIDQNIFDNCCQGEAMRCIHVGLLCTQIDPLLRPIMSNVCSMLSKPTTLADPTKPAIVDITTMRPRTSISDGCVTRYRVGERTSKFNAGHEDT